MKTDKILTFGLSIGAALLIGMGLSGCKKVEPTPEIVENPLDQIVYHIGGKVTDGTNGLAGVKVTALQASTTTDAKGLFQLPVKQKGVCLVTFSKDKYVEVTSEAVIPSDALKSSSVVLLQEMVPSNPSVTISPDNALEIVEVRRGALKLSVPAGAVKQATDVTITDYKPGQRQTSTHANLTTVHCVPSGLKFEKTVPVMIKSTTSPAIYFEDVTHYVEQEHKWVVQGTAPYNAQKGGYESSVTNFSNHSFGPKCQLTRMSATEEDLSEVVVDNLGKLSVVEREITCIQKSGWVVDGDLPALIKEEFVGLSDSDVSALAGMLTSSIQKGTAPGLTEAPLSLGIAKVSGDTKMTVNFKSKKTTEMAQVKLMYRGDLVEFAFPISSYMGVNTRITYQYGPSRTDHSGGGGK